MPLIHAHTAHVGGTGGTWSNSCSNGTYGQGVLAAECAFTTQVDKIASTPSSFYLKVATGFVIEESRNKILEMALEKLVEYGIETGVSNNIVASDALGDIINSQMTSSAAGLDSEYPHHSLYLVWKLV